MLTPETIQHIARLSRLDIVPDEIPNYLLKLETILSYVEQLNAVDTHQVEPSFHPFATENITRTDKIVHTLSAEQVFQNTNDSENHCFKVPQILGSS